MIYQWKHENGLQRMEIKMDKIKEKRIKIVELKFVNLYFQCEDSWRETEHSQLWNCSG